MQRFLFIIIIIFYHIPIRVYYMFVYQTEMEIYSASSSG